ncbi:MAG: hypothetical protein ABIS21_03245 [Acidimicrobiales bacterium]
MTISRSPRFLTLSLAIALGVAGCGGGGGGGEKAAGPTSTSTTPGGTGAATKTGHTSPPLVTLTEPGAEPRKRLRLALVEGSTLRAALTLKFGIELEADGKALPSTAVPALRVDLSATVAEVMDNGDARVGFAYERIEVVDDGTAAKEVIEQIRASGIDKLADVKGETTINPRGVAVDGSIDLPKDLPPALEQVVNQLSQQTGSLTVAFPEEAVGQGARWSATTDVDAGGIRAKLVLTYVLRELAGDGYVLDVSYDQSAGRQDADFPGLPAGTKVELQDLQLNGKGEITGNVASVFPIRSTLSAAGTAKLNVASETEKGKLLQRLAIDVMFETLPPA